jgi:DNA-binding transcriptional LysR family regulator
MGELEALSQSFKQKEEPEIFLAVDGISPIPKLLHLFKSFSDKFPHTKLNIGFNILSETERRVLDREAQIGITHIISDKNIFEIIPITSFKMIPVMDHSLFKERKIKNQSDLLSIDQIVLGDQSGPKGISFGLLHGGKKWRISDGNFKRSLILAGLGWGHLAEHTIEQELKEKKLVILNFEDIHSTELTINLIRHKKHHFGVVTNQLWNDLISLSRKDKR